MNFRDIINNVLLFLAIIALLVYSVYKEERRKRLIGSTAGNEGNKGDNCGIGGSGSGGDGCGDDDDDNDDNYDKNDPDNEFDDPKLADKANAAASPPKRVVGYYTNWARYRKGAALEPKNIPTRYVTDIVYAFFPIDDNGIVRYSDPWSDLGLKGISDTVKLRGVGSVKRVLFSIGGWTYSGPDKMSTYVDENSKPIMNTKSFQQIWNELLLTKESRSKFIDSAVDMMKRHDFDGIDIDYEYPCCPQGDCRTEYAHQADSFVSLLRELRDRIGKDKLITLATAAADKNILSGPNMKIVTDIVDYLNVMTYDYFVYGGPGGLTGHNQPKREIENGFNVNHTLWRYIKIGCDPAKLNIGVALYGRGFTLSPDDYRRAVAERKFRGIKCVGPTRATRWTQQVGVASYYELKTDFPDAKSIYVPKEGSWLLNESKNEILSYTDVLDVNALNGIRLRKRIGGVLLYALDQDDYDNLNGFGRFSLLETVMTIGSMRVKNNMF
jgi:chitinase